MADPRAPGVYFEESSPRTRIAPAGVGLIGFMGPTYRGRTDRAQRVSSWADFERLYGGFSTADDLAPKVYEFFTEGGVGLSVARLVGAGAVGAYNTADFKDHTDTMTSKISATSEGVWGNDISVDTLIYEKTMVGAASGFDRTLVPVALPANTKRLVLTDLNGMSVGDVLDVIDSTGALVANGPVVVVGFDVDNNDCYVFLMGGAAVIPNDAKLRCASQHRASTTLTAQATAAGTFLDLANTDGIAKGSVLTLSLFSQKPTIPANSYCEARAAVVSRVVGQRAYLSLLPALVGAMDLMKQAQLQLTDGGGNGLTFTSVLDGADGNEVSIALTTTAGVLATPTVTVVDRAITVLGKTGTHTLTDIKAALDGDVSAQALITTAIVGVAGTMFNTLTPLTGDLAGGALAHVVSQEFKAEVYEAGALVETHEYLSMNVNSADFVKTRLGGTTSPLAADDNNASTRVLFYDTHTVEEATALAELKELPRALTSIALASGADGASLFDGDYVGASNPRAGMYLFDAENGLDGIAAPGWTGATFQRALCAYCENRGDVQAILDIPTNKTSATAIQTYREITLGVNSGYGHLVGPRLKVYDQRPDAQRGAVMWMPASATFAGLLSRTMNRLGAHRSPGNSAPITALALEVAISEAEHGNLNEAGVSIFRDVANRGLLLFGDRTLLRGGDVRHFGNVRRWLNFFKRSLLNTLSALAFEPANEALFQRVFAMVDGFLEEQWKKGALYPQNTKSQAYSVKCDSETTTVENLRAGEVYAIIQVSPVTPAEKFIFRLGVSAGGISVSELT